MMERMIFKRLKNRGEIDTSKVRELNYFSTHANINYNLDKYINKYSDSIKKGSYYYKKICDIWTEELDAEITKVLKDIDFHSKYKYIFKNKNTKISYERDKTFAYGGLTGNNINVINLSILLMALLDENDINKILKSKEFEIIIKMIQDYIDFIDKYLECNQSSMVQFINEKGIALKKEPSDFDSLNLLTWKFFRDVEALKYATKKAPLRYKKLCNNAKYTLLYIYLNCCIVKLNNFAF